MRPLLRRLRAGDAGPRGAAQAHGARARDTEVAAVEAGERVLSRSAQHGAPPATPLVRTQQQQEELEDAKEYAKQKIVGATSAQDLLRIAEEVVMDDWLAETRSLQGNIYKIMAFGRHTRSLGKCSNLGWKAVIRVTGFAVVILVQWGAPPLLCMSEAFNWGVKCGETRDWSNWGKDGNHLNDWGKIKVTKILSMILICIFCLNAMYTVFDNIYAWRRIVDIFAHMHKISPSFQPQRRGEFYLYLGGITNMWIVVWCVLDSYFVIGGSLTPMDCVMDALAIVFLFSLDDIDDYLSFVSGDVWPGARLGWIYDNMVRADYQPNQETSQPLTAASSRLIRYEHMRPLLVRTVRVMQFMTAAYCAVMAVLLPVMVAVTPFLEILVDVTDCATDEPGRHQGGRQSYGRGYHHNGHHHGHHHHHH